MKKCKKCGIENDDGMFRPHRHTCKLCTAIIRKIERQNNKEFIHKKDKEYNFKRKEKLKEYRKTHKLPKEKRQKYRSKYKDKIKIYNANYSKLHAHNIHKKHYDAIDDQYLKRRIYRLFNIKHEISNQYPELIERYKLHYKYSRLLKQLKNGREKKSTHAS
jgi:hypothetical protein